MANTRAVMKMISAVVAATCCGQLQAAIGTESPFVPRGGAAAPTAPQEGGAIEFRGVISTSAGLRFAIYEPSKQKGEWVGLDEAGRDFVVKSYDEPQSSVRIDYQGRTQMLTLKEAKFDGTAPVAVAPAVVAPAPVAQVNPGVARQRPAAQVAPADTKALLPVQEEIKRRRAARSQPQAQPAPAATTPAK